MRKDVARRCHIYSALKAGAKRPHLSFHTPGHKKGKWDVTELSYTDNLACPQGCIAQAERDIAQIVGAHTSFILTDGSTCGVLSMLYAAKTLGAKRIAFPVDAHQSVWQGCELLGLEPLVFMATERDEVPAPPTFETLAQTFAAGLASADAVLLTCPNYYGKRVNLTPYRRYCDETGKLLLIDGAHGGHLHFLPDYAGRYADLWVDGVHKSLPALTQGAVVSARTEALSAALLKGVRTFRTTSPSYPVMASVEYAVKYPANPRLEKEVLAFMKSCPRAVQNEDWTKLCIRFGTHANAAFADLERQGIYAEFCDGEVVEFYLSPATSLRAFQKLKKALKKCLQRYPYEGRNRIQRNPAPLERIENRATEWVDLDGAEGRLCAATCGLFPPCTPLLLAGERIQKEKLAQLAGATNVFGLANKKILVVKEDEQR